MHSAYSLTNSHCPQQSLDWSGYGLSFGSFQSSWGSCSVMTGFGESTLPTGFALCCSLADSRGRRKLRDLGGFLSAIPRNLENSHQLNLPQTCEQKTAASGCGCAKHWCFHSLWLEPPTSYGWQWDTNMRLTLMKAGRRGLSSTETHSSLVGMLLFVFFTLLVCYL